MQDGGQLILWYGKQDEGLRLLADKIQTDSYLSKCEILSESRREQALDLFANNSIGVVISEDRDFLKATIERARHATRILVCDNISEAELRDAINGSQVFRILFRTEIDEALGAAVRAGLVEYEISQAHFNLVKESARQNREWEALNLNLEKRVEERTRHIEISKEEEDDKLAKVRGLIRFVNDLAVHSSFDEIMHFLRKENRSFHQVGDPILIYQLEDSSFHIFYFRNSQIIHHEVRQPLHLPEDITIQNHEFAQVVANHLGRPLLKLMTFPIDIQLIQSLGYPRARSVVCLESSLDESRASEFLDHMLERNRPLSIAVDRALLENEMRVQSYRWEKTFDGLKDPIAIITSNYDVLRSNNKFSDRDGGKKCFEIFAGIDHPCEGCPLPKSLGDEKASIDQIKVKGKTFEVHGYPIRLSKDGSATTVVNQYVDVTQARELYMRLLQSEKMGAIGILAGNIAHELNNPLTGIRSLTQVLQSAATPGSALAGDLDEIEKAAARSQSIIRNLLEYSENKSSALQNVSLDEVVERTIPMMKTLIRRHRFHLDLDSSKYRFAVEPQLLQQVVFNLVNNACQAMSEPGELGISTALNSQGTAVELCISDTGPGIPDDIKEKIFEPFFTTKREGQGTGLGLSLSREIVRRMGGDIFVETRIGKGSRFKVTFQLDKVVP